MMDLEYLHAKEAIEKGLYVTYFCNKKKMECGRVGSKSLCFCGHKYANHTVQATKKRISSKCTNCPCKEFQNIPQRPEECGMYWLPRRKDFKMADWRAKCKCGLGHDQHSPVPPYQSKQCQGFYCDFNCITCDCRWEDHVTLFEFEDERAAERKKIKQDYLPLNMNQELHNLVFHTDRKTLPQYNRPNVASKAISNKPSNPYGMGNPNFGQLENGEAEDDYPDYYAPIPQSGGLKQDEGEDEGPYAYKAPVSFGKAPALKPTAMPNKPTKTVIENKATVTTTIKSVKPAPTTSGLAGKETSAVIGGQNSKQAPPSNPQFRKKF